jgi:hypothetical protein
MMAALSGLILQIDLVGSDPSGPERDRLADPPGLGPVGATALATGVLGAGAIVAGLLLGVAADGCRLDAINRFNAERSQEVER